MRTYCNVTYGEYYEMPFDCADVLAAILLSVFAELLALCYLVIFSEYGHTGTHNNLFCAYSKEERKLRIKETRGCIVPKIKKEEIGG